MKKTACCTCLMEFPDSQWEAVQEEEVYEMFLRMYYKLLDNRELILKPMLNQLRELRDRSHSGNPEQLEINNQITELVKQNRSLARLRTKGCIDSAIFIERSNRNNQKIEKLQRELRQLQGPDEISRIIESTKLLLELLESELLWRIFLTMKNDPILCGGLNLKIVASCFYNGIFFSDLFSQSHVAKVFTAVSTIPVRDITIFCASWFLSLYLSRCMDMRYRNTFKFCGGFSQNSIIGYHFDLNSSIHRINFFKGNAEFTGKVA